MTLPLAHRLWRCLPQRPRRAALARLTAALAPRLDWPAPSVAPGLAVAGELGRDSGLGEGARLMLAAVPGACAMAVGDRGAAVPPAGVPLVVHASAPGMAAALLRLPRGVTRGRRVIGYWAWELPVAPASWRAGLEFVHEVWVPSQFTAGSMQPWVTDAGRVLRCVPHPVAVRPPAPSGLSRADFGIAAGTLVVLVSFNLASSFERKNPLGAIAAFVAAFGSRTDCLLVIKLTHERHFVADFERLVAAVAGHGNIRLDTRALPAADAHALTACADIVLSLHRSEGFGLVPAEAMLLERAVVATGWSGNMEYMDAASVALVGATLVPARDPRGVFEAPGAVWAEPDLGEAVAHLRRLEDAGVRAALGRAGAARARAMLGGAALHAAMDAWGHA